MLLAMRSEITPIGSRVRSQTLLIRQRKITRTGGGVSSRRLLAIRRAHIRSTSICGCEDMSVLPAASA